jgi:hypothetical protein
MTVVKIKGYRTNRRESYMSTLNIIGIVVLVIVASVGVLIKFITKKKLEEFDGMSDIYEKPIDEDDTEIYV